jgi:hypothetical protein
VIGIRSGAGAPSGYSGENCQAIVFLATDRASFNHRKTRSGRLVHCPLSIPARRCNPMSVVNWHKDKTQNDEQRLFLKRPFAIGVAPTRRAKPSHAFAQRLETDLRTRSKSSCSRADSGDGIPVHRFGSSVSRTDVRSMRLGQGLLASDLGTEFSHRGRGRRYIDVSFSSAETTP